jgi:CheY-like chemotaxis protein
MDAERPPRTALVVDDEPEVASTVRAILEHVGFRVTCILNAELARQRLPHEHYDVMVTDMVMPEVDGMELIREARQHSAVDRIIAISGGSHFMVPEEALRIAALIGANAVLQKPFTPAQLIELCTPAA